MAGRYVRCGSWLCENAKPLNRDRRSYSSKTVLVAQRASGFDLEIELKNIILRRVSIFEFLHSQGQTETSIRRRGMSVLPPIVLENSIFADDQNSAGRGRDFRVQDARDLTASRKIHRRLR